MLRINQIYTGRFVSQKADTAQKYSENRICLITKVGKDSFTLLPIPLNSLELGTEGPFNLYGSSGEKSIRYQLRACKRGEVKNLLDSKARKLQLAIDEANRELREFNGWRKRVDKIIGFNPVTPRRDISRDLPASRWQ